MKGTDCTPGQLAAAGEFLERTAKWPADVPQALVKRDEVVRAIAWYGALRFVAGRDGVGGTLDQPGGIGPVNSVGKGD